MILWLCESTDKLINVRTMLFDEYYQPMFANTNEPYGIIYIPI